MTSTLSPRSARRPRPVPKYDRTFHSAERRELRASNLVLVARSRRGHARDFPQIVEEIRRLAPDVSPLVISDRFYNSLRPAAWWRPTLSVSTVQRRQYRPLRGAVCENRAVAKSAECLALEKVGVPVPRWAVVSEHHQADLSDFGDYVVVKPDRGGRGAEVKIKRKGRVRWSPPQNQVAIKAGNRDLLVQQFIYTGRWPVSYRVTTLFGQVLFSWKVEASRDRRPLLCPDGFRQGGEKGGGIGITSSGAGCRFELCYDQEVLALGRRAHAAFPDHPLLGADIVRDELTGRLYVIELNTCGEVWHFSSNTGLSIQRDNRICFADQFDGLRRAACVLVEETRRRAK